MEANVGGIDKVLRILLGLAIIAIGWFVFQSWWALIGVVLLLSGLLSRCMLYKVFGINTRKSNV